MWMGKKTLGMNEKNVLLIDHNSIPIYTQIRSIMYEWAQRERSEKKSRKKGLKINCTMEKERTMNYTQRRRLTNNKNRGIRGVAKKRTGCLFVASRLESLYTTIVHTPPATTIPRCKSSKSERST